MPAHRIRPFALALALLLPTALAASCSSDTVDKAKDTAEAAAIARRLGYQGPMKDFGKSPQGIEMKQRAAVLEQLSKTGGVQ